VVSDGDFDSLWSEGIWGTAITMRSSTLGRFTDRTRSRAERRADGRAMAWLLRRKRSASARQPLTRAKDVTVWRLSPGRAEASVALPIGALGP